MHDCVVGFLREVVLIILHGSGVVLFVYRGLRCVEKVVEGLRGRIGQVLSGGRAGLRGHAMKSAEQDAQRKARQRAPLRSHAEERFSPGNFALAGEEWFSWFEPLRAFSAIARYLPV